MKPILVLLLSCLLAACASGPAVHTDRDPAVSFAAYRTYGWKQEPAISNPLLKQRIVAAIDAELAGKGWRLVPQTEADVVLVGNVSARDEQTIDAFYDGPGWTGWNWRREMYASGALQRVEVHTYKVGTLVLDLFDAKTQRAVWRATAEGTVPSSQERINENAMKAVREMFVDFPTAP